MLAGGAGQLLNIARESTLQINPGQPDSASIGSSAAGGTLAGTTIAITRAADQAEEMGRLVEQWGGTAIEIPVIEFRRLDDQAKLADIRSRLGSFDWILFTSTNGIRFFFEVIQPDELDPKTRFACVGRKSAAVLKQMLREPDFVPDQFSGDSLAGQLPLGDSKERVLLPGPVVVNSNLVEGLQQRGAVAERWPIYETRSIRLSAEQLGALRQCDIISFASPSAVDALVEQLSQQEELLQAKQIACIGSMTAQRCGERGIRVDLVPEEFTAEGMLQAIAERVKSGK